jgi:hypothetical protein
MATIREPYEAELERQQLIAQRAYELFEARGGEPGHDQADWFEAERQVDAEYFSEDGPVDEDEAIELDA